MDPNHPVTNWYFSGLDRVHEGVPGSLDSKYLVSKGLENQEENPSKPRARLFSIYLSRSMFYSSPSTSGCREAAHWDWMKRFPCQLASGLVRSIGSINREGEWGQPCFPCQVAKEGPSPSTERSAQVRWFFSPGSYPFLSHSLSYPSDLRVVGAPCYH